ncbi:putative Sugar transporter STL1 (putative) [Rhodotorula toruloides]|uniref:BY PROTMAP: gi/647402536/emb/CDR48769.1/ RHTO0S20e01002g1_1 [Rhodosporidium toruloides] n=1 Tax=Rhodotorula toruloides TaxID=5286 RepID=A0A0K3CQC8_RHOTO|nr:putative Sugar transporter STL1 (putative) [Rhodotorula toruloides]
MMLKPFTHPWGEGLEGTPLKIISMIGACAGFLTFGYDQGIANALTQNPDFFKTMPRLAEDTTVLGTVLALFVLGAMFGCLTMSALGNKYGRRPLILFATITTLVGAGGMAGANGLACFCVMRLLNGYGVGILTSIVPTYVGEISKPRIRGMMMSLELVAAATGLAVSFWVAWAFRHEKGPLGWRLSIAIQAFILLFTLVTMLFAPESPRWLMEAGRVEEGRRVLARLHGQAFADAATLEIQDAIAVEHAAQRGKGYAECFANNDQCFRYRTFLAIGVNAAQQLTGINMATYYSANILINSVGMTPDKAVFVLGFLGVAGWVFMLGGAFVLMDGVGRVRTMIIGAAGCCVGQILLAAGVAHQESKAAGYVATAGLFLFLCIFSATHLPTAFVYSSEIVPLAIRTRSATLGVAVQYILNFVVVMVVPTAIPGMGGWGFYALFAGVNGLMVPVLYFFCPEVSGLSLEDVDSLFTGGKVRMRRTTKVEQVGGIGELEANKVEGSFDHVEKVESGY